ncbi:uncharacterized protein LOC130902772 isoform X1 [Diorhabda carinulata]|uniref:uncharacterized protein LOC130902772 isoform X1 n=1 Tax=Diorhabda carinulata TaxID=1163345 RepID=UPI0025A07B1B|nr:uncharacterized protein LOC130902772 isoform X1 [Diorhabda carinulata]
MNNLIISLRNMMLMFTVYLLFLSASIPSSYCKKENKVIIIGAGSSGIAALSKLLENDINDVLVLEAESRIGGRINTVNLDGTIIELGAEWCHGEKNNTVYEILKERNLLDLLHRDEVPTQMYLSSRQNISEELSNELFQLAVDAYNVEYNGSTNESMASIVGKWYNQQISTRYSNDKQKLEIFKWNSDFLRHVTLCLEGCFSWEDASYDSEYEDCDGYFTLGWGTHGYKIFLDVLTKKYPNIKESLPVEDKILFNKEVSMISTNESDVFIVCSDNSTYQANHVIFTPSLGVLKEKASTLFPQGLPSKKLLAIERIGMGAVMKVFLKYETKWWRDLPGFDLIWTENDRVLSKQYFPDGPTNTNGESWIVEMYNIVAVPDSNVLLVWFTGELVPLIEKMDEKILIKGIEYTLDKFFGHLFTIPRSQKFMRSNWYSSPHFRGTYSFSSVNSSVADILSLQAPIINAKREPIVLFAGEATNPIHHATVHGAVESGFREADRLIEFLKK